jgi:cytochrome c oxidase assembly protein subunit 15
MVFAARPGGGASPERSPTSAAFDLWRNGFARVLVLCTFALLGIGALVTSTNSGLAVPDWPRSYGMWLPPMVGGVFFEHGHRMAAGLVGLLTLVLALWTQFREGRRHVRILAWGAFLAVVAQGLLGGLTVLFLLPTSVSVAHACLAQAFFCAVIAYAFVTSPEWLESGEPLLRPLFRGTALFVAVAAYGQLIMGAIMRHLDERSWAAATTLPIPDFPLSLGRIVPPLDTFPVAIHFAHRLGALVVFGGTLVLLRACRKTGDPRFERPALGLVLLVLVQIALGGATVLTGRGVLPTTAHVLTGALILGTAFLLTLRAYLHTRGEPKGFPALSRPDPIGP